MAAIVSANAQTKPLMAEEVFKNVQVLKGIPADEFMNTMGFFAASLSFNCTSCHGLASAGDVARFADDTPLKQTARKMILIVRAINQANFAGMRRVTCYTLSSRRRETRSHAKSGGAIQYSAAGRSGSI